MFARHLLPVAVVVCAVATLTISAQPSMSGSDGQRTFHLRTAEGEIGGGFIGRADGPDPPHDVPAGMNASEFTLAAAATAPPFPFYPQAGTLWQDIPVINYVDIAAGPAIQDFECSNYSYDGHNGHDSILPGFREQEIGVPVFAALDGRVVTMADGYPDRETTIQPGRPSNFVVLSHAGGYATWYYHLKRSSVAVALGQTVKAGTQIGLTASSGNSGWPHLHFTTAFNNVPFEANAGACRPGPSYWRSQANIRRDPYVTTFTFGNGPFTGSAGYPRDEVARTGTYVLGTPTIYFRLTPSVVAANSTYRIVIRTPDGSTVHDGTFPFGNTETHRSPWYWFSRNVPLTTAGEWTLDFYINATHVVSAPFSVVAAGPGPNRPPLPPASMAFDPASPTIDDAPFCRVTPISLYRRDPDYDLVRYRYQWTVNGIAVRQVVSAALSDALAAGIYRPGDELICTVTPFDETTAGAAASVAIGALSLQSPSNLVAAVSGTSVLLTWSAATSGLTPATYVIEAGSASGAANLVSFPIGSTATSFSTHDVPRGTYYVRVRAAAGSAASAPSNEVVVVVPQACSTPAPSGVRLISATAGTVRIDWDAPPGPAGTYWIEAGSVSGATNVVNTPIGTATSITATNVPPGVYYVRLRTVNSCGVSPVSNEIVVRVG